jgi:hypothetical protein
MKKRDVRYSDDSRMAFRNNSGKTDSLRRMNLYFDIEEAS